jgi:hypothetical protein
MQVEFTKTFWFFKIFLGFMLSPVNRSKKNGAVIDDNEQPRSFFDFPVF